MQRATKAGSIGAPPEDSGTRERILGAARELFASRGFRGATTKAIAAEAGVNEVTVFRIYGSKDAVFRAVLEESFPKDGDSPLAKALAEGASDETGLAGLLARFMDAFERDVMTGLGDLLKMGLREAGERPELARLLEGRFERVTELLASKLRALEREGVVAKGGSALAPFIMASLVGSSVVLGGGPSKSAPAKGSRANTARHRDVARILAQGLRAREA